MKLVKFLPNRVWRVYLGGACLDAWRDSSSPVDGLFPEEWIASTVLAMNSQHPEPGEGLSRVVTADGQIVYFKDLLEEDGENWLGREHIAAYGRIPGFLTKLLDSAIRLPLQAHPDVPTSRRLFNSSYGKTEAWVVLGGRRCNGEDPYLLMGFNERFDEKIFREEALSGKMTRSLEMFHKYPITPGEVIIIPGGFPHAIGPGALIQEIMEPSDWVVQPEDMCGTQPLTVQDRFCGLEPEKALEVFHYDVMTMEQLRAKVLQTPVVLQDTPEARLVKLLDRKKIGFFGEMELNLRQTWKRPAEMNWMLACTMLEGSATVSSGTETIKVAKGDTFAVAASANPVFTGNARILMAHR